jgi:PAS domain S-box-containing protein
VIPDTDLDAAVAVSPELPVGRRAEALVASLGEAILSADLDGTIETWNPAAELLYGYSAEQMIGASVSLLAPDGGLDELTDERRPIPNGGWGSSEASHRRVDGRLIYVAITRSPLCDDAGAITGAVSVVHDVSESRRDTHRLAEAESRFAGAFAAASTGMALTAPDGRFLAVNPALCRFLARDADALLASCVQEVTHPDDLPTDVELGGRALAGEIDGYQQPKRYLLPDGGIVWGLLTISVSRDAEGVPQHYVSQVQDITAGKTAEGEIGRYAARLQALSDQDPLTGLLNRRTFSVALEEELRVLAAGGSRCSVLLAQVDGDDAAVTAAAESLAHASRETDHVAHLGDGELAVLLPGVLAATAAEIVERIAGALGRRGVRSAHATDRPGESAPALLDRLRADLPAPARLAPGGLALRGPDGIARLLDFARTQLGMPISFLTRLDGEDYVFVRFSGASEQFGLDEDDALPLAGSHCQLMLDGRIGSVVPDLAAVPVRLRSGEIYGTLCGIDTRPHPELSVRQIELLGFLGGLVADLLDAEADEKADQRTQAGSASVRTLLVALEARDFYTSAHSKQVVELASAVARRLGLDDDARRDVEQVANLHDIGKVGIPDSILQKQGPLDEQEWQLMRRHPVVGEHIIAGTPGLSHLAPSIRAEHENWDGSGYPDGLTGEQIPLASRITLACDALNAMTSDRPYRPAMTLERAVGELQRCAGSQFDPQAVTALLVELGTDSISPVTVPATFGGP